MSVIWMDGWCLGFSWACTKCAANFLNLITSINLSYTQTNLPGQQNKRETSFPFLNCFSTVVRSAGFSAIIVLSSFKTQFYYQNSYKITSKHVSCFFLLLLLLILFFLRCYCCCCYGCFKEIVLFRALFSCRMSSLWDRFPL